MMENLWPQILADEYWLVFGSHRYVRYSNKRNKDGESHSPMISHSWGDMLRAWMVNSPILV